MRLLTFAGLAFVAFSSLGFSASASEGDALFDEDGEVDAVSVSIPAPTALFGNTTHPLIELDAHDFNVTVGNHSTMLVEL
jgi:hypothetical protein